MKVLSEEKIKVLAERNGWSAAYAEGYVDGESFRRHGMTLSKYAQVGIDEYSLGVRAGYYERSRPRFTGTSSPHAPVPARKKAGGS